jgi:aerobic-type carbon monoxide dehydrogenase small subunit (CoxS/CutS family)
MNVVLNGKKRALIAAPGETLLEALRAAHIWSAKRGCDDEGVCGNCAVIVDGRLVPSCLMLAAQADGAAIDTVEGLARDGNLHPIQEVFLDEAAVQCGYCTPAMILAAKVLIEKTPQPTEDEVREALEGILCRCTGYVKPIKAILAAAARVGEGASR